MIIINGRNIWPQDIEYLAEGEAEIQDGGCDGFLYT